MEKLKQFIVGYRRNGMVSYLRIDATDEAAARRGACHWLDIADEDIVSLDQID